MHNFAERLNALRAAFGFPTDPELAKRVGISARTLYYAIREGTASARTRQKIEHAERAVGLVPSNERLLGLIAKARSRRPRSWAGEVERLEGVRKSILTEMSATQEEAERLRSLLAEIDRLIASFRGETKKS